MKVSSIIKKHLKSRLFYIITGFLIYLVGAGINVFLPKWLGFIIDAFKSEPKSTIYNYTTILLVAAVLAFAVRFLWRFILIGGGRWLENQLRQDLFAKLLLLYPSFYIKNNTGDIITRSISDVNVIRQMVSMGAVGMAELLVTNSMTLVLMVTTMGIKFSLIAIAPIPLQMLVLGLIRKAIVGRQTKIQEAAALIANRVNENLTGIRDIKAYTREQAEVKRFSILSNNKATSEINMVKIAALPGPISQLGFGITFVVFMIFGSILVFDGRMTTGDFIAVNGYIILMTAPVMRLSRIVQVWQRGKASIKRIEYILGSLPDVNDENADMSITDVEPTIKIDNLDFGYDDKVVLKNINIEVKSGNTLGIVGKTGSGKSSLISAITRQYKIPEGKIFVGGIDINKIPIKVLRNVTGAVVQDGFVFGDTIYENIRFAGNDITREKVEEAAQIAALDGCVNEFPDRYETVVGERGVTLSGGQRQRVSIARAIAKSPKILLFDDCLSAVDTETEEQIINNIKTKLSGITTIIVAHRVSAVAHADEIIYLEYGEIFERGTHEQLLELKGKYFELFLAQTQVKEEQENA